MKPKNTGIYLLDLNGDGVKEIFAYDHNSFNCGSAGCSLTVYQKQGGQLSPILRATVYETMGVGDKTHNVYRDIYFKGGNGKPIRWTFDGHKYIYND